MADPAHDILVPDDLKRVYFRAQHADESWGNVNALEATNLQFHTWAMSRCPIADDVDIDWPLDERVRFCHLLYQQDALYVLKRGSE